MRMLRSQVGSLTVEILVIIAAVAVIAGGMMTLLYPSFTDLHNSIQQGVTSVNETGF